MLSCTPRHGLLRVGCRRMLLASQQSSPALCFGEHVSPLSDFADPADPNIPRDRWAMEAKTQQFIQSAHTHQGRQPHKLLEFCFSAWLNAGPVVRGANKRGWSEGRRYRQARSRPPGWSRGVGGRRGEKMQFHRPRRFVPFELESEA
jgi:hypothetical protein